MVTSYLPGANVKVKRPSTPVASPLPEGRFTEAPAIGSFFSLVTLPFNLTVCEKAIEVKIVERIKKKTRIDICSEISCKGILQMLPGRYANINEA